MTKPFSLVSWHTPFLEALHTVTCVASQNQPGNAVVIFPHNRPKRYFQLLFREPGKPCLLPQLFTGTELFAAIREEQGMADSAAPIPRTASLPDQVALLRQVVQNLAQADTPLADRLGDLDMVTFYPWGVRLAQVLEECLTEGLAPADLHHAEGEVADFAAALLSALSRIFYGYTEALHAKNLTTPGLNAFTAVSLLGDDLPEFLRDRTVILAGFNALNGTEEQLFRHLWARGATVCLHGDPNLATTEPAASCCTTLRQWMRRWGTACILTGETPLVKQATHFFVGHDLHSQIAALQADLASQADQNNDSLAIALTNADTLLPVLHHLPDKDCNVSVGYPLERSVLCRLLDAVLNLQENMQENQGTIRVHWRAWLEVLRHPCVRLLGNSPEWRQALQALERLTRSGGRFAEPRLMVRDIAPSYAPQTAELLDNLVTVTLENWAAARTSAQLSQALWGLCQVLLEQGAHLWERFPLDAECLFRLMQGIIPALRDNELAHETLPWPLLRTMLQSLLEAERVPFEADPVTGAQILGMLETRLLHFDRIHLLDVTEDQLPGSPDRNPLLPDSLRAALGLAGTSGREMLAAYTFSRLLAGARSVYLYWQKNDHKQPSRLVEERIWQEEQRQACLLKPGAAPLRAPSMRVKIPESADRPVSRTPRLNERMDAYLTRPLSATALDTYLSCPLRFYYERLCKLELPDEAAEGDDPLAVGELVHETLFEYYAPWKGKKVAHDQEGLSILKDIFLEKLEESGLLTSLPPESAAMLQVAGPERLRRFWINQPPRTTIHLLEESLSVPLAVDDRLHTLTGKLDRVDRRSITASDGNVRQELVILDYKTGKPLLPAAKFWNNDALWATLLAAEHQHDPASPLYAPDSLLFEQVAGVLSLQLPLYLWLYRGGMGLGGSNAGTNATFITAGTNATFIGTGTNAAFVELRTDGKEISLFPEAMPSETRELAIATHIPLLLRFVLRHMRHCPQFFPRKSLLCSWCFANKLCRV